MMPQPAAITPELWQSLGLTLRLAAVSTSVLLLISIPLAWWLSQSKWKGSVLVEALVNLPIVLPPTVLGFYLLVGLAPDSAFGRLWHSLTSGRLVFTFSGLVIGSVIYSMPYAVQPMVAAFRGLPMEMLDAARTLGANGWRMLWSVALPASRRALVVATVLGFAHTIGEFGVVMMIGGSIPGQTRVASIALYDEVQKMNFTVAHTFALTLLAISYLALLSLLLLQRPRGSE